MSSKRRKTNITLIILSMILGAWAVGIFLQPIPDSISEPEKDGSSMQLSDISTTNLNLSHERDTSATEQENRIVENADETHLYNRQTPTDTRFKDADIIRLSNDTPFRIEAQKVLSGQLEENDSASRHRILSYCEHLRASYTTRDIDFLRQVFSDNALIIVGHTVKTGNKERSGTSGKKVEYGIRSKKEYLERLEKIFDSNKKIDVDFSDFKIMRHPTMEGIYGVTLRQRYSCDRYSDDGYLFLLWDFRDPTMPLIHVRTWQPTPEIQNGNEEVIEIGDFNFE